MASMLCFPESVICAGSLGAGDLERLQWEELQVQGIEMLQQPLASNTWGSSCRREAALFLLYTDNLGAMVTSLLFDIFGTFICRREGEPWIGIWLCSPHE